MHVILANMSFGKKLAELRKERDLSQAELAEAIGIEKSRISNWENGKGNPSLESLVALSKLFAVSIDYLVFDNVPREGFEAINDFELYEHFRKTESLPKEQKETIRDVIDGLLFREKVKSIPESESSKTAKQSIAAPLGKLAKR